MGFHEQFDEFLHGLGSVEGLFNVVHGHRGGMAGAALEHAGHRSGPLGKGGVLQNPEV